MDRALDPGLLSLALGEQQGLPTPEELSRLISEAEIGLLLGRRDKPSGDLEATAWYLHGIASTSEALDIYGVERRTGAFRVSAHVFDVLLDSADAVPSVRARWAFAASIGFRRCGLDPNADAIYRRVADDLRNNDWELFSDHDQLASLLGTAALAVDARTIFGLTDQLLRRSRVETERLNQADLRSTPLAAIDGVVRGARALMVFLLYGRLQQLETAIEQFRRAVTDESAWSDYATRWVAAHLAEAGGGLRSTSIWTTLPPDTPRGLMNVLSLGSPRITSFWPPQLEALNSAPSPLSSDSRRAVLGMPTSAGKTLFSQVVVLNHLLRVGTGVAFIAPTRSLCNEVRASLESRLEMLDFSVVSDLPDRGAAEVLLGFPPDVEVMTPERLHGLLRQDAANVLERFGLFVFDEVHNVSDETRGWNLEATIAFLHAATANADHKILLMSAALGNQVQFVQWMAGGELDVSTSQSDWRAPRRLHSVWTTYIDFESEAVEQIRSKSRPIRWRYDLHGRLIARSRPGKTVRLETQEPVGVLSLKLEDGKRKRDGGRSTPAYQTLAPLVSFLESTGPVLVIQATRPMTVWTARALAEGREVVENAPGIAALLSFVGPRLGVEHPIHDVLRRGVGYHHGSLPLDVREAIEDAVRDGHLRTLVATTTLTEGINLPVKSVIVAALGSWGAEGYQEFILGAKLINAIGRAGRATRETEGIVVLAWNQEYDESVFDKLDPPAEELVARSLLLSAEALEALLDFEELRRNVEDAVLRFDKEPFASVLASLWFVEELAIRSGDGISGVTTSIQFLQRTLAWTQLSQDQRDRLEGIAALVRSSVAATPAHLRRRWARAGSSIPTAVVLSELSDEIASLTFDEESSPTEQALTVLENGRLERLLSVGEAPRMRVYSARGGKRSELSVPLLDVLREWMRGRSIGDLGDAFFAGVKDRDFRAEQVAELVSDVFEQHLPWTLGILIEWSNEVRAEASAPPFSTELPLFVRWGVESPAALDLILNGVRSRQAANAVVAEWQQSALEESLREWLASQDFARLRRDLELTNADLTQLLRYIRDRATGFLAAVIGGRPGFIPLPFESEVERTGVLRVVERDMVVDVLVDDDTVGSIQPQHSSDVLTLVSLGIELQVTLRAGVAGMEVAISEPPEVT